MKRGSTLAAAVVRVRTAVADPVAGAELVAELLAIAVRSFRASRRRLGRADREALDALLVEHGAIVRALRLKSPPGDRRPRVDDVGELLAGVTWLAARHALGPVPREASVGPTLMHDIATGKF